MSGFRPILRQNQRLMTMGTDRVRSPSWFLRFKSWKDSPGGLSECGPGVRFACIRFSGPVRCPRFGTASQQPSFFPSLVVAELRRGPNLGFGLTIW